MAKLEVNEHEEDKDYVFDVKGRLDTETSKVLEEALGPAIADAKSITLELKELTYISSMGLRVLIGVCQHFKGSFTLKNVNVNVYEILCITGINSLINIENVITEG